MAATSLSAFQPPEPFDWAGECSTAWRKFKFDFDVYLEATDLNKADSKRKTYILLNHLGPEGRELYQTFTFDEEAHKTNYEKVMKKFDEHFLPTNNLIYERFKFFTRKQAPEETHEQYLTSLKKLSQTCDWGDKLNDMLLLVLVIGLQDNKLQERLLRQKTLDLETAKQHLQASAMSKSQAASMSKHLSNTADVAINNVNVANNFNHKSTDTAVNTSRSTNKIIDNCYNCGKTHKIRKCPAYGHKCRTCGKLNHYSKFCRKGQSMSHRKAKKVHAIYESDSSDADTQQENSDTDTDDEAQRLLNIRSIDIGKKINVRQVSEWTQALIIQNEKIHCTLDSLAEGNIISQHTLQKLGIKYEIKETKVTLVAFGGQKIHPLGKVKLQCKKSGTNERYAVVFYVTEFETKPILGLTDCVRLNLIKRVQSLKHSVSLINKYSDLFTGLGAIPGETSITIDPTVKPTSSPRYRVPFAIRDRLKKALDLLEEKGIVEKIKGPTTWLSNLVIVEKADGSLRLCLDPRDLNRAIIKESFPIPTLDDVMSKLAGKRIFSVIDQSEGFFQLKLDRESSELCAFSSPYGNYRFLRMPMGIKSAPEIFMRKNYEIFGDIEGLLIYFDDFIIFADTEEEHDRILKKVFQRAREHNIRFNKRKCKFRLNEVKFLGHIVSAAGLKMDPERINAISDIKTPTTVKELQRFLGMVTYVSKFISNLAELTSPLRELLKRGVEWQWGTPQQESFQKIKDSLAAAPILQYFDPNKPIVVQADASQNGLGACLLQESLPVAFASRSLSEAEQGYSQIEKELLAIVFSCEKFHQYIYGHRVVIESDHKPLETIVNKKKISKATARIQKLLLRLLKYELLVQYKPGKYMHIADALSRAALTTEDADDLDMTKAIHAVSKYFPISPEKRAKFQVETDRDPVLRRVKEYHQQGWPRSKKQVDAPCRYYYNLTSNITEDEGLLFMNDKLIVPNSLRQEMVKLIHEGHQGMTKSKKLGRSTLFWPGMSRDIEDVIANCSKCLEHLPKNRKEPLIPHELPDGPWQKLGLDLAQYANRHYLVIKDFYSKYIVSMELKSTKSSAIIVELLKIFMCFGMPQACVADNVPFNSAEFKNFCKERDIECIFSSPYHSQSNGMAESGVKIVKKILKKAGHQNLVNGLLNYNNTPVADLPYTPAQMLSGRNLKCIIPVTRQFLHPQIVDHNQVKQSLQELQEKQKQYYDRQTALLPPLQEGNSVRVRKDGKWKEARVIKPHDAPRSYLVQTMEGATFRRNRRDLRRARNRVKKASPSKCLPGTLDPPPRKNGRGLIWIDSSIGNASGEESIQHENEVLDEPDVQVVSNQGSADEISDRDPDSQALPTPKCPLTRRPKRKVKLPFRLRKDYIVQSKK